MVNTLLSRFGRPVAAAAVLFIASQLSAAAALPLQEPQQPAPPQQSARTQQSAQTQQAQPVQPASSSVAADLPQSPSPAAQQSDDSNPGLVSRSQDGPPQDAQKPVGTAAGPVTTPSGVAGSRPSGAVIAPAKQRRVKALFIRYGLIVAGVGAAAAVYGLSSASPSHPQ